MTTSPDDRIGSLIGQLVAAARPVRRLRPPGARLAAWLGVVLAVATVAIVTGVRPDVTTRLAAPRFLGELACLGVATAAAAWIALRGAVPGLEAGAARRVLAATLVGCGLLGFSGMQLAPEAPLAGFVATGIPCSLQSIALALVPWGAMLWAVGRGAPLRALPTCALGGLAAALGAYLLMRLRCPLEEATHVAVWHGAPVVLATLGAAAVGILLARARRAARLAL